MPKPITLRSACKLVGASPQVVLGWIAAGKVTPAKVEAPNASGFYWQFTPEQIKQMKRLPKRKRGGQVKPKETP